MTWDRGAGVLPTTHRFMTATEYYDMPEGPPYFQLIEGELFMSPSPRSFHRRIVKRLLVSLENHLEKTRSGEIVLSPSDVELDEDNVYQPDLYYVGQQRLHLIDEQGMKGAPDFAVEVISASTGRLDYGPKKLAFARSGTKELWTVVPMTKSVEIWILATSVEVPAQVLEIGDTLTTGILPGWSMPVGRIFE